MQTALEAQKAALRKIAATRRAMADPAFGRLMVQHVLKLPPPPGSIIGGYWPLGSEIDPRPLLHTLHGLDYAIALPVTPATPSPLGFRQWHPDAPLRQGRYNTRHPDGPALTPSFILVPLLAYDLRGHRLGYGGGYYDRTLAALPGAFRLGLAYAAQAVPELPADEHDIMLHAVATESGITSFI